MHKFIITSFILVSFSTLAQFGQPEVIDVNAGGITKIITLDINNDGLKDIAVAHGDFQQNMLSYYLNLGDGEFSSQQILDSDVIKPSSLATGDFNNDGWQDVVSFSGETPGGELLVYLNNNGTFDGGIAIDSLTSIDAYTDVLVSDIDNDNDEDLIVISDIKLMVFQNNGNAIFSKTIVVPGVSTENYSLTLGDIDANGFIDIIVGGVKTLIYSNNNGVFNFDSVRTDFINNQFFNGLVFLTDLNDFDNDGDLDLLIGGANQTDLRWHRNDGNGLFTLTQVFETNILQCKSIASKDLDNDGDIDVLTSYPQTGRVVWYANNGDGEFGSANLIHQGEGSFFINIVSAEDLTNDGYQDIIWSDKLSIQIADDAIFKSSFE